MSDFKTAKEVCEIEIEKYNHLKELEKKELQHKYLKDIIDNIIAFQGTITYQDCQYFGDKEFYLFKKDSFYKEELEKLGYKVKFVPKIIKWYGTVYGYVTISACCKK